MGKRASGGPWASMMLQRHNYTIVIVNQLHPTAKSATQEHVCISEDWPSLRGEPGNTLLVDFDLIPTPVVHYVYPGKAPCGPSSPVGRSHVGSQQNCTFTVSQPSDSTASPSLGPLDVLYMFRLNVSCSPQVMLDGPPAMRLASVSSTCVYNPLLDWNHRVGD